MCITHAKPKKVDCPTTVYKAMVKRTICYGDNTEICSYATPYFEQHIEKEIVENGGTMEAKSPKYVPTIAEQAKGIGPGYIHAYSDLGSAASELFVFFRSHIDKVWDNYYELEDFKIGTVKIETEIWECEVPASEEENYCWEGLFDGNEDISSLCARRMKFVRKVEEDELNNAYREWQEKKPIPQWMLQGTNPVLCGNGNLIVGINSIMGTV